MHAGPSVYIIFIVNETNAIIVVVTYSKVRANNNSYALRD